MMSYIEADDVVSPKARWKKIAVLRDDGPGDIAYAIGEWDGARVIAVRWNGIDESPIGNPQSRGLPTWTILPSELYLAVIQKVPEEKQVLARTLLDLEAPPVIEMKVDVHDGSGRHTLKVRESGQRMFEDVVRNGLCGNLKKAKFLESLLREVRRHLDNGTRVVLHDF